MKKMLYGLIDCNNFYASCQRVFNPGLQNKPIVILSNNDGCIISRSNEAKALGIPMGAPYFKYKGLIEKSKTAVFSSNFSLYGDMSARVMSFLPYFSPDFEVYSIDEAFLTLDLAQLPSPTLYAKAIQHTLLKSTGLPVSIGLAPTKTLAKVANYIAKKKTSDGIFELTESNLETSLASLDIEEVWGIGRKLGPKLRQRGILTALDLKRSPPVVMRRQFNVIMEKMVHELNGYPCLTLEDISPKDTITSSRSFGQKVTELSHLKEALATHCAKACQKLRAQGTVARGIILFIKTSKHDENQLYFSKTKTCLFDAPLSDTGLILEHIDSELQTLFQPGLKYSKAGVTLIGIEAKATLAQDFITPSPNRDALMSAIDNINRKFSKDTLIYGSMGTNPIWQAKQNKKSPNFTTNWKELPLAYAN